VKNRLQSLPFKCKPAALQRGVAAIPYSVDLWTHYCGFAIDQRHEGEVGGLHKLKE
jgi:hypothetical protein